MVIYLWSLFNSDLKGERPFIWSKDPTQNFSYTHLHLFPRSISLSLLSFSLPPPSQSFTTTTESKNFLFLFSSCFILIHASYCHTLYMPGFNELFVGTHTHTHTHSPVLCSTKPVCLCSWTFLCYRIAFFHFYFLFLLLILLDSGFGTPTYEVNFVQYLNKLSLFSLFCFTREHKSLS